MSLWLASLVNIVCEIQLYCCIELQFQYFSLLYVFPFLAKPHLFRHFITDGHWVFSESVIYNNKRVIC